MKKYIAFATTLALLGAAAGYVYGTVFVRPSYESQASLIVLQPDSASQVKDYADIARSRVVLGAIGEDSQIDRSYEQLRSSVAVTNPAGTNILRVVVSDVDEAVSLRIAQQLPAKLQVQAERLFGRNNIDIVDEASVMANTSEGAAAKMTVMGAVAGFALVATAAFIFYTPRKEEQGDDSAQATETHPTSDEPDTIAGPVKAGGVA